MTSNLTPNRNLQDKGNELRAVLQYLSEQPATATKVAVDLNIYRPNLCRRKRTLQKQGKLAEIRKVICPITRQWASLLTANPDLFPADPQLSLFQLSEGLNHA